MPTVPQYQRSVSPQVTPNEYVRLNVNEDMFGTNISRAQQNVANAINNFGDAIATIQERIDNTRIVELDNKKSEWMQEKIYDKENGYLYKMGKDAYGQSETLLNDYDKYMTDLVDKSNLSPSARRRAQGAISKWKEPIQRTITQHDFEQGVNWSSAEAATGLRNYTTSAVNNRNNSDEIDKSIESGYQIIEWQGEIQHLDRTTIDAQKIKYKSNVVENVLSALIGDGSLKANEYFEAHKDDITPDKLPQYVQDIRQNELKYTSRTMADEIIASAGNEEDALKKAEEIEDIDLSDAVQQRIRQKYAQERRIKEQNQSDLMDEFLNKAAAKIKNGEQITEDDIPKGLDGQHFIQAKTNIDNLNNSGEVQTDTDTETYLWYTATNDADRFKGMNLDVYKLSLSKSDFAALKKRQQDIQKGDYFTIVGDTKATKEYIRNITGISNKDEVLYNEYQGMVRALEQKFGRSATDVEKEKILKYLGTNKDGYKLLERGVREEVGFYKNIANKISYYASRHNGEMPPENEVYKWLKEDTLKYYNKKYSDAQTTIKNIASKPNETKTLTYLADVETRQYEKDLGLKIKITSRYREANGKWKSHHTEGTAMDVSMSEHNLANKKKILKKYLDNPNVQAVGTSDEQLLNAFKGKYKNKLVDERSFDAANGTDHKNHIHITSVDDGTQKRQTDIVTIKNILKRYGYSDAQISEYFKKKGWT